MPVFVAPMISLYSRDLARAAFYSEFGFLEISRTPETGDPVHIELTPQMVRSGFEVAPPGFEPGLPDPEGLR